jgi:hypothetical protein
MFEVENWFGIYQRFLIYLSEILLQHFEQILNTAGVTSNHLLEVVYSASKQAVIYNHVT